MSATDDRVSITVDGELVHGSAGCSLAGLLLASGRTVLRRSSRDDTPRGLFCGIGVCFECTAAVNGLRDVRMCQRIARQGDVVEIQADAVHPVAGAAPDNDGPGGRA